MSRTRSRHQEGITSFPNKIEKIAKVIVFSDSAKNETVSHEHHKDKSENVPLFFVVCLPPLISKALGFGDLC